MKFAFTAVSGCTAKTSRWLQQGRLTLLLLTSGVLLSSGFLLTSGMTSAHAADLACENTSQFTFSWQFADGCNLQVRGGTSSGAALTLDTAPSAAWQRLQENNISTFEKDRRAILAMAGGYRVSFDFLETAGYTADFEADPPYQSWGTEYVYVVEDRGDFISLQHIMVMEYVDESGAVTEPMVQKHWRQDWHYQQDSILVFNGKDTFTHQHISGEAAAGRWAQSVYQVDDSPRYAAVGKWQHMGNVSTWLSDTTWRPLPRRESSFRQDYDVLIGSNRHTITPTGWIQEEENYKVVLAAPGQPREHNAWLSKELGVARYERVSGFDFSAGDQYWGNTAAFWQDVRRAWQEIADRGQPFVLNEVADGVPLFMTMFMMADEAATAESYDSITQLAAIRGALEKHVTAPE